MQVGRHRSSALKIWWVTVLSSKGSGGRKTLPLPLSSSSSSSFSIWKGVYSNQKKAGPQTLALGLNLNAGLIPSPPNDLRQFSHSTIHARLPYSDGFPQLSGLPTSPRFPSLCMIPYWDFYNHLCLLYPYQNHSKHALLS